MRMAGKRKAFEWTTDSWTLTPWVRNTQMILTGVQGTQPQWEATGSYDSYGSKAKFLKLILWIIFIWISLRAHFLTLCTIHLFFSIPGCDDSGFGLQHPYPLMWRYAGLGFRRSKDMKAPLFGRQKADASFIKPQYLGVQYLGNGIMTYGYGSIPINTIFSGMNIHLPAILMFTRGTRFWHTAILLPFSCVVEPVIFHYLLFLSVPFDSCIAFGFVHRWFLCFCGCVPVMHDSSCCGNIGLWYFLNSWDGMRWMIIYLKVSVLTAESVQPLDARV